MAHFRRLVALSALISVGLLLEAGCRKVSPRKRNDAAEAQNHTAVDASDRDGRFWSWFAANEARLAATDDLKLAVEDINAELERSHPNIFAEAEKGEDGRRTLVITADGDANLVPVVKILVEKAPRLERWDIIAFRQPTDLAGSVIEMDGKKIEPSKVRFVSEPDGEKIGLHLFVPGYVEGDDTIGALGFIVLDHTIGEYAMATRIGGIELYAAEEAPPSARPLAELRALVAP